MPRRGGGVGRVVGGPGGKSRDKHWVRPEGGSIPGPSRLKSTRWRGLIVELQTR